MKTVNKLIQFIFLLTVIFCFEVLKASPDLIVVNADIRTSDPAVKNASAVAVENGKFTAIGATDEISQLSDSNTVIINAQGKTLLPGFIDSHTHLSSGINIVTGINLTGIIINGDDFEQGASFDTLDIDNNRLTVAIHFTIIGVPLPQVVSMNLQRLR